MGEIGNQRCLFMGIVYSSGAIGSKQIKIKGRGLVNKPTVDVQRVQKSTIRMNHIYKGAEHVGIKGTVHRKMCCFPTCCDP